MIRNYLKIAIRNLLKHKFISFINLFGLTVGISCCLLILGFILHELSYDRFHSNAKNIYRVGRDFSNAETGIPYMTGSAVAPPVGPLLENDFKDIEKITTVFPVGDITLLYGDKKFKEDDVFFADKQLFQVFDVEVVQGNPATALSDPFSIMLTEEMARKYFGDEDPINKSIRLENQMDFKVTGIYRPFPDNSHMHPQIMLSFNTLKNPNIYGEEGLRTNWGNNSFYTYLLLPDDYDPKQLEVQFPAFLERHISPGASEWTSLHLTALTDIHFDSQRGGHIEDAGEKSRVYIFAAIALFILLIACINYMNLSTARSVLRAREIGVRKVIGAGKGELVMQFLSESVLIAWLSAFFAFVLTWIAFPWLNQLSGLSLSIDILLSWKVLIPLLLLPFAVGILSGLYPALFLSSFQPVKVLKGFFKVGSGGVSLRQALVVAQFSISIILIICTLVVQQQLGYVQNKTLGFNKEQIITLGALMESLKIMMPSETNYCRMEVSKRLTDLPVYLPVF